MDSGALKTTFQSSFHFVLKTERGNRNELRVSGFAVWVDGDMGEARFL